MNGPIFLANAAFVVAEMTADKLDLTGKNRRKIYKRYQRSRQIRGSPLPVAQRNEARRAG